MSRLVVCEKPSVAKSISSVLGADRKCTGYTEGNDYVVSWCFGHLVGLMFPDDYNEQWSGKWCFEQLPMIPDTWKFKITESSKTQFAVLKKLMNDSSVSEIICATDADREGECIFRYVYIMTGCKKPVKRLWISSLEETAIRSGFDNLKSGSEYDRLYSAGFSRAKADWLVGMNASRLFSCRYCKNLSIGRVQTPTLALIVQRDSEVSGFVKQKYFTVDIKTTEFTASTERIDSETEADNIAALCNGKEAFISKTEVQNKSAAPPKLYDLTTLQREANRILGYNAQQTLEYLQSLYEGKLTTYPRTDSQYISDDMRDTALAVINSISNTFSEMKISGDTDINRCINNSKVDGHHAIIPTVNIEKADINGLPEGQKNILLLISARLLAAVSSPHYFRSTKITLKCENTDFFASGKTVINNGWKNIYADMFNILKAKSADNSEKEEISLPELNEGEKFSNVSAFRTEHFTSPPKSFTEDTLLSAMEHAGQENYDESSEKKGLGTPATRAGIIETLVSKGYIERNKKKITATEKGKQLISVVPDEVKSAKLTADWEMKLQNIEKGKYSEQEFMDSINGFIKLICNLYGKPDSSSAFAQENSSSGKCPVCGNDIASGKFGLYCKGKCGMQLSKVYGKSLTDNQIKNLLSGKSITLTDNSKKTTVLPETEPFSYTSKDGKSVSGHQWKTERKNSYGK